MEKHTPGPWHACRNGECKCNTIMNDNDKIATITRGDWGDTWASLKIEGDSFAQRAVPFVDKIVYGHIPDEQATANANLIAAAPEMLEQLAKVLNWLDSERADYLDVSPIRAVIAKARGTVAA